MGFCYFCCSLRYSINLLVNNTFKLTKMGLLKGALILSAGICIGYSAYHCIYIDEKFGETGKEIAGNVSETVTEGDY